MCDYNLATVNDLYFSHFPQTLWHTEEFPRIPLWVKFSVSAFFDVQLARPYDTTGLRHNRIMIVLSDREYAAA
jgi:hypothetical protein